MRRRFMKNFKIALVAAIALAIEIGAFQSAAEMSKAELLVSSITCESNVVAANYEDMIMNDENAELVGCGIKKRISADAWCTSIEEENSENDVVIDSIDKNMPSPKVCPEPDYPTAVHEEYNTKVWIEGHYEKQIQRVPVWGLVERTENQDVYICNICDLCMYSVDEKNRHNEETLHYNYRTDIISVGTGEYYETILYHEEQEVDVWVDGCYKDATICHVQLR